MTQKDANLQTNPKQRKRPNMPVICKFIAAVCPRCNTIFIDYIPKHTDYAHSITDYALICPLCDFEIYIGLEYDAEKFQ